MEKDFRLFVKNLPVNITENRIKELFEKHVTVNKVDLKEKKDFNDQVNRFSFVNVTATDKNLNSCVFEINGQVINGSKISVELAKESFLDRLKKERDLQDKPKKEFPKNDEVCTKHDSFINIQNNSPSTHKKFSDLNLTVEDSFFKEKKRKKSNLDRDNEHEEHLDNNKFKQEKSEDINCIDTSFDQEFCEQKQNNLKLKSKNAKFINKNDKFIDTPNDKKVNISDSQSKESEKRLMIAKQKRYMFKLQKQTIQDALKCVDGNKPNKKIVFNDDVETSNNSETNKTDSFTDKSVKKRKDLFDSDDEQEYHWNEDEFEAKADLKNKLMKFKVNTTDKRFALDERFVDEEDKVDKNENLKDSDVIDEKKWQLNILEEVLGKSIKTNSTDNSDSTKKKYGMMRYDPSDINHKKYEVTTEKSEITRKTKKRKSNITEVKEDPPVPVSAEVFYEVSDTLIENLKTEKNEKFSLLKTLGRESLDHDVVETKHQETDEKENFKFESNGKNPFKYDSTDDETEENTNQTELIKSKDPKPVHQPTGKFFTDIEENDPIVFEAKQYFQNISVCDQESFKRKRRELKEIIRTKSRRYLKKTAPTNRKKVWKVKKKSK